MEYRNGTCGSCNATYKIPASFTHDRARCKECGGTVEIGPLTSDSGSGEPELEPYVPSGKKRSGPSMKEQLLARRRTTEGASADGDEDEEEPPQPARKPAGKPASRRAAAPKAARPASRRRAAADDDDDEAGATASKRSSRGGRRSGGGGRRGGSGRGGRRGAKAEKQKSKAPMLIGLIGLVILLGGAGFLFREDLFPSSDPVDAATKNDGATSETPDEPAATDDAADDAAASGDDAAGGAAPSEDGDEMLAAAEEPEPEEKSKTIDPAAVDLDAIEDFEPVDDTDAETWADIQEKVAQSMDPSIGIAQVRAQKYLEENGRIAFPAIVNYMKALDLSTEDGTQKGMWAQRMLENICNGANFGWKEYMEDAEKNGEQYFHYFNKRVVEAWCKAWAQAETSLDAWKNLAKLSDAEFEQLKASQGAADDDSDDDDSDEPSPLDLLNED